MTPAHCVASLRWPGRALWALMRDGQPDAIEQAGNAAYGRAVPFPCALGQLFPWQQIRAALCGDVLCGVVLPASIRALFEPAPVL